MEDRKRGGGGIVDGDILCANKLIKQPSYPILTWFKTAPNTPNSLVELQSHTLIGGIKLRKLALVMSPHFHKYHRKIRKQRTQKSQALLLEWVTILRVRTLPLLGAQWIRYVNANATNINTYAIP